jgi:hypothetical protein
MNAIQIILKDSIIPKRLFFGSPAQENYMWNNLVIEKHSSVNWLQILFKGSIFDDFWILLSSSVT